MSHLISNDKEFLSTLKKSKYISKEAEEKAEKALANTSLPNTRNEAWKYTRVAKLNKIKFANNEFKIASIDKYIIDQNAYNIVFVNGNYSADFSSKETIDSVTISLIDESSQVSSNLPVEDEIFNSINTLFLNGGVEITINNKAVVNKTIQIIHILKGQDQISNFRTIINAGDNSDTKIIQSFFAEEDCANSFINNISEITVNKNAHLVIDKIQYENEQTYHISTEEVTQDKDSTFTINTITLNGMLVRNNLNIAVVGENCTTNLNGAYLLKNKQHVDNHTVVDHKVANCNSNELYKGVIDNNSTAVFNGKVFVRKDAQKINAFQSNGNVLLTDDASINSKPELEIYADDVKCSHGSTTGQLDDEAIFYLRARGISEKNAKKLLISAFVEDVFEKIASESVNQFIEEKLIERFHWNN